jgi:uncharacterized protein (TIGR02145 family)
MIMKVSRNGLMLLLLLSTGALANAQTIDDWTEIQKVLTACTGRYPGANNNVATSGLPDGPLLGNGNVGVVGSCDHTWGRFYVTTTDFWTGAHLNAVPLPIGGVNIIVGGIPGTGVEQDQDMLSAETITKLTTGLVEMHTWVSATRNLLVSEIWTTGNLPVDITAETWVHLSNTAKYPVSNGVAGGKTGWVTRETESGKEIDWVCRAALATSIIGTDYTMSASETGVATAKFKLEPGKKILVVTAVHAGKNVTDHITAAVAEVNEQTEQTISSLHQDHLSWWKNYWMKSFVRTYDPQLEKYYFGALYESACAYREGSICGGLFGPWVTTDKPNWDGNYTLSYNHQATVAGFASSNRPELLMPYIQQRYDWEPEGRRRAQRGDINFVTGNRWGNKFKDGIPGIFDPITQAPWGNSASEDLYMGMLAGSVWGAIPLMWYCNYTQDLNYLKTTAYPYLKGIADFWEAYLVKEDGKWLIKYTAYNEWASNDNTNTALDNAFVKELFKNMIRYSIDLDTDATRRMLWQDIVKNMLDLPKGNWNGQFVFKLCDQEMLKEGSWPGLALLAGHTTAVTMGSENDLVKRFIYTLDAYNSWEISPNAVAFLWVSAVKGGYPAQSLLDRFQYLLSKNMRRNFTVPKGGHGTESVANLEYINSCMLQSQEGFLRFFPAWPKQEAKFVRLRAQGAFLVSGELIKGEVSNIEIRSEKGRECTVLNPWPGKSVSIIDSKNLAVNHSASGDKIIFPTKPGESYRLKNSGISVTRPVAPEDKSSVRMGNQVWMAKNLDVIAFRNGDPIPEMKTNEEWIQAGVDKKPAWCYYDNNPAAGAANGKLYNGFAMMDPRGLAPEGYHVATDYDWVQLASYLGGRDTAGLELKKVKGFGAMMGGYRNSDGKLYGMGVNGYWWSTTILFQDVMWNLVLNHKNSVVFRNYSKQSEGLSVRCIRD